MQVGAYPLPDLAGKFRQRGDRDELPELLDEPAIHVRLARGSDDRVPGHGDFQRPPRPIDGAAQAGGESPFRVGKPSRQPVVDGRGMLGDSTADLRRGTCNERTQSKSGQTQHRGQIRD